MRKGRGERKQNSGQELEMLWYVEAIPADDAGCRVCTTRAPLRYASHTNLFTGAKEAKFLTFSKVKPVSSWLISKSSNIFLYKSSVCTSNSWPAFCFVLSLHSSLITLLSLELCSVNSIQLWAKFRILNRPYSLCGVDEEWKREEGKSCLREFCQDKGLQWENMASIGWCFLLLDSFLVFMTSFA